MRVAVLDLGTNTFNLLVAEVLDKNNIQFLHSSRIPVKIGKNGIQQGIIPADAIQRAMAAISLHQIDINNFHVEKTLAYATSAIRSASNGKVLTDEIHTRFGIDPEIISGDQEAELIYQGVKMAMNLGTEKSLILDIGGGSIEFIIANQIEIFWKMSFDLGIARLLEIFNPHDPILPSEVLQIESYSNKVIEPLKIAMKAHNPVRLIGAAGSFETFSDMINQPIHIPKKTHHSIYLKSYFALHKKLLLSNEQERMKMEGLEKMRVEMIVTASVFVNFIVRKFSIKEMIYSDYSLKEGVLFTLKQ